MHSQTARPMFQNSGDTDTPAALGCHNRPVHRPVHRGAGQASPALPVFPHFLVSCAMISVMCIRHCTTETRFGLVTRGIELENRYTAVSTYSTQHGRAVMSCCMASFPGQGYHQPAKPCELSWSIVGWIHSQNHNKLGPAETSVVQRMLVIMSYRPSVTL